MVENQKTPKIKKLNESIFIPDHDGKYALIVRFDDNVRFDDDANITDLNYLRRIIDNDEVSSVTGLIYNEKECAYDTLFEISADHMTVFDNDELEIDALDIKYDFGDCALPLTGFLLDLLGGRITMKQYFEQVLDYIMMKVQKYVKDVKNALDVLDENE